MIPSRPYRFQTLLAGLIIVGTGGLIAAALAYARTEAVTSGRELTQSIVAVMAEQGARTVQEADHKMQLVAGELLELGGTGQIAQRSTDQLLRRHLVGLPFVRALWVLDPNGRIIADSDHGNIGVSLADRDYFRAHKEQAGSRFFLGAPVRSRSIGSWLISAAYPLRDHQGALLGVLAAAIEPPYFENLWGAIDFGPGSGIDLYRQDGTLMASSASPSAPLGQRTTDSAILAAVGGKPAEPGPPLAAAPGADDRMVIGQRLGLYPQLTLVGYRSWRGILAPWRQFSMLIVAVWLAASAGVLVLYSMMRRTWLQRDDATEALTASEAKFCAAFRASPDAIMLTRASDGVFVEVSDSVARITGYPREYLVGQSSVNLNIWARPEDRDNYISLLKANGRVSNVEADFRVRSGEVRTGQMSGEIINVGGELHILGIIRDISEAKVREALIWKQAHYDTLTQLPNRAMFVERLRERIGSAVSASGTFALLMVDLDEFKEVNDSLGHDKGDHLLIEVAKRITACLPPDATVARLGGDEFAVILPGPVPPPELELLLGRLIQEISSPFMLDMDRVFVSASVGVAPFPAAGTRMAELLRHADQAMYAAKQAGRNRFVHFHHGLQAAALERAKLTNDLRTALGNQELEVFYQPIVALDGGGIRKAEALLRWHHPVRGYVSPAEFIPLAETSGLIIEIGEWVFIQALAQVQRVRALFDPAFQISINVSPVQVHSDLQLTGRWLERLRTAGVDPGAIAIEITEGVLLDLTRGATDTLKRFSDAGIEVALDDFGTGYSSLAYLRKFDIDYLKIDRAFIHNVASNAADLALCEAIVAMAHKLGLKVIVEGIETAAQLELMKSMGGDFGQGFHFSRPVPAGQFEALL